MEKNLSPKEDHEEPKVPLGDAKNPVADVGSAAPHRAAVEERTVSFNLGDLEEAPEQERLPSLDLNETSIDSGERWWGDTGGAGVVSPHPRYPWVLNPGHLPWQELCSCPTATSSSSTRPWATR